MRDNEEISNSYNFEEFTGDEQSDLADATICLADNSTEHLASATVARLLSELKVLCRTGVRSDSFSEAATQHFQAVHGDYTAARARHAQEQLLCIGKKESSQEILPPAQHGFPPIHDALSIDLLFSLLKSTSNSILAECADFLAELAAVLHLHLSPLSLAGRSQKPIIEVNNAAYFACGMKSGSSSRLLDLLRDFLHSESLGACWRTIIPDAPTVVKHNLIQHLMAGAIDRSSKRTHGSELHRRSCSVSSLITIASARGRASDLYCMPRPSSSFLPCSDHSTPENQQQHSNGTFAHPGCL